MQTQRDRCAGLARRAWTSGRLRVADGVDRVLGRHDPLIPPRRTSFVGNSDFRDTGDQFLDLFVRHAGLSGGDRVLDVGCGIGRMARPLTRVLSPPTGSYDGFDVVADGIAWCQEHYRDTGAPFRFAHVDLHNAEYNPGGREQADQFTFPYRDDSFDLALATSVFTHLLSADARHYVAEIARTLAPAGRLFSTWFVLGDDTDPQSADEPMINFHHSVGDAVVADPAAPAAAVAYPKRWLETTFASAGMTLRPVIRGTWTGRAGPTAQDIVIGQAI
jgi:SAM-dependent methyltransferase